MGLFDKLESKLEQGVNGAFARAFKSEVQPVEIASGIRRAMDDRAASVGRGKRPIVPNLFTIELSPTDYERLSAWGDELDDELIASAQEHADEQRYSPGGPLTVVLQESDTLETGVFRLRPATAKAADALAHRRAHPRPQRETQHPDEHDTHRDSATHSRGAGPAASTAASGAAAATSTGARPFGQRIKDYLLGSDAERSTQDNAHEAHDAREYERYESTATHADGSHDSHYDDHDPYAENTRRASASAPAGTLGTGYSWGDDEDDAPRGFDDEHPDNRFTGGANSTYSHAWDDDDDDDDYGDPTGFSPAHDDRADATSRFNGATQQPPRNMSPRERPWLKIDGQRYPLLGAITVLGRDDEADIVIDDPGVSRGHSEIRITHDGPHLVMSVRDLGSTNGTYVNGERIDSTHVRDGDRLTLGRTSMTIHLGDRT